MIRLARRAPEAARPAPALTWHAFATKNPPPCGPEVARLAFHAPVASQGSAPGEPVGGTVRNFVFPRHSAEEGRDPTRTEPQGIRVT